MSGPVTIRCVLFDLYRTLIDIWTDEGSPRVWEELSRFLAYHGVWLEPRELSSRFFAGAARQQQQLPEEYAEVDIALVFRDLLMEAGYDDAESLSWSVTATFRVLSIVRFSLFPDVLPALERLRPQVKIGIVSDAQRAFFQTELAATDLDSLFDVAVASGEQGFHKPDPRLFRIALERLDVSASEAVYVGDSVDRDMCGARAAGVWPVLLDRLGDRRPGLENCRPLRIIRDLDEFCSWVLSKGEAEAGTRG